MLEKKVSLAAFRQDIYIATICPFVGLPQTPVMPTLFVWFLRYAQTFFFCLAPRGCGSHLKISQIPIWALLDLREQFGQYLPPIYGVSKFNDDIIFFAPPPGGGWGPSQNFANPSLGTLRQQKAILTVPTPLLWGQ